MTDFSAYLFAIDKRSAINDKSISSSNQKLIISRSALTGLLVQKLIRNPGCFQSKTSKQKQYMEITSRWNKLQIPRPIPIKFSIKSYTCFAINSNQPFVATGNYDGSIILWKSHNSEYRIDEKLLLKSRLLTVKNVVFHKSLPLIFAIDFFLNREFDMR